MIFVMMMFDDERKKNKSQKNNKEERRDLSLSLLHFLPPASRLFSELFGFVCSKHSIKVYISYHLHDDRERERERERTIKRERREKEEIFLLSPFL